MGSEEYRPQLHAATSSEEFEEGRWDRECSPSSNSASDIEIERDERSDIESKPFSFVPHANTASSRTIGSEGSIMADSTSDGDSSPATESVTPKRLPCTYGSESTEDLPDQQKLLYSPN